MRNRTAAAILLAAALTACGGEKPAATSTATPSGAGSIPEDLRGVWEATIVDDQLAVPPDGLPAGPSVWTLKFLGTGGEDNGPSVFLSNDRAGELAGPISVSGRQITLESEPTCRKYRFEHAGNAAYPARHKLYLEPLGDLGRCPSTPMGSVLAAGGWTRGPQAPTPEEEWPLERIRDEGAAAEETVTESGLAAREYVVCDGPRWKCEGDPPLRGPYQHAALELTRDGRSALFSLAGEADDARRVTAFDETSVLAIDNPRDALNRSGWRYRLLRVDGTEILLDLVGDTVPAAPGSDVVVVDFSTDTDPGGMEHALRLDERAGTLRPLDLRRNADLGFAGRSWGPNTDEFLWFVSVDCRVSWVVGGVLEQRRLDCAHDFEFDWRGGDYTHVDRDWFPDGWLKPGRMALLERVDDRLILHMSLDRGSTWQRIRVSGEAAVPGVLRRLG